MPFSRNARMSSMSMSIWMDWSRYSPVATAATAGHGVAKRALSSPVYGDVVAKTMAASDWLRSSL